MAEGIKTLIDYLESIWSTCRFLLTGLVDFFKMLGTIPNKVASFLSFLPPSVLTALLGLVAVVIVYKMVGRD